MPPENLRAIFGERLKALETLHISMVERHDTAVKTLTDRLESHVEETERQFVSVNASMAETQGAVNTMAKTMNEFITTHNAVEKTREKQSIKTWQLWGLFLAVVASPFISKAIDALFSAMKH